ncbi:hypothetical protein IKR20_01990 [bacterium]|nr:hypothetical protein [bacterium]
MQSETKVLMIVAFEKFRDEEFSESFNAFRDAGTDVTVASIRKRHVRSRNRDKNDA